MRDLSVWTAELRAAAAGWDDQRTALRDARAKLAQIESSTSAAGARVQPALDRFLAAWVDELDQYARAAERYSDSLEATARDYDRTDGDARADLEMLLPWTWLHPAPTTEPGPS